MVMDEKRGYAADVVHLARLGMVGRRQEVETYIRRMVRRATREAPALAEELSTLLATAPTAAAPLRDAGGSFVPVDQDSRLQLLRHEHPVVLSHEPILAPEIASALDLVINERSQIKRLALNGLVPTRTLLFTGKPGLGKTLTARWVAARLDKPLLTLDLATVISSFLGRTGSNLRHVLDYAKSVDSVLLLDEFDAIAKRRGDETELGELKRLVTVLLQEIDLWPSDRLLIAATNHGELLDPAVWRRFDLVLEFPPPTESGVDRAIDLCFGADIEQLGEWRNYLIFLWHKRSFSDIARSVNQIRRRSIVAQIPLERAIVDTLAHENANLPLARRKQIGERLLKRGLSQRKISAISGLTRDTLRKMKIKDGADELDSNMDADDGES